MPSVLRPRFGFITEAYRKRTYEVANPSMQVHGKVADTLPVGLPAALPARTYLPRPEGQSAALRARSYLSRPEGPHEPALDFAGTVHLKE